MIQSPGTQKPKVLHFLKQLAPYSIVDLGIALATEGNVVECSRAHNTIQGVVRDREGAHRSVTIEILTGRKVEATCDCSSRDEMEEQWCPHSVALLWRACDLDFFDPHGGFAPVESAFRMNTSSPREIAAVIEEMQAGTESVPPTSDYLPAVTVVLVLDTDRLGIQLVYDGEPQEPLLFEGFARKSSRALDNMLLQMLDEQGTWDEQGKAWYISSSSDIEMVVGLLEEYENVISSEDQKPVTFSSTAIDADLVISWREGAAELEMFWVMPEGEKHPKQSELLGTGPYWTVIQNEIFRLAPQAARIDSIFPYSATVTLPRSQVGPILEIINRTPDAIPNLSIRNPELQPASEVKTPLPVLEIKRRDTEADHFSSQNQMELMANLEFQYPSPPEDENLVYLPDHEKEQEHVALLKSLGFTYHRERKCFNVSGDTALDFVYRNHKSIPKEWEVQGLKSLLKSIRFADLAIDISLSSKKPSDEPPADGGPIDWFDCHVSLAQSNANIPISTIFKTSRGDSNRWVRLDNGAFARVPGGGLKQLKTTLGLLSPGFRLSNTIKASISAAQAISLGAIDDDQIHVGMDRKLKAMTQKLRDFDSIDQVNPTRNFVGTLRSYQVDGLSWLNFLNDFELGGILADEMGLGKTVQALALLQRLKDSRAKGKKLDKPALIVAPTSVITNWCYEAKRFTPKLKVLLLHGPLRKEFFEQIPNVDLVVTSYALLRLDRLDLQRHQFSYLILDEAQNIKNPSAATTKAAKSLRARHRLALTGTPTENRPLELWSILDFLMPGYLGSMEFFRNSVEKPLLEDGAQGEIAKFLNGRIRPFVLRRTKAQVERDLPAKIESELHVEMTASQRDLYAQILTEVRPKVFEAVDKRGIRGASVSILAALLRLRQVCNHPNSIEAFVGEPGFDSGKFNLLQELITESIEAGRKVLVFSQFREMLAIIRRWLEKQSVDFLYLDGSTRNRQDLIDQFNDDEKVRLFLISLKAGGTGLNLTAADTVIIYDPWWNPAVESQAVDRAHRIGQTKPVSVYRLVTENSIEQKIMQLKARKEKIVDALINEQSVSPLQLTKGELESLFSPISESVETFKSS